MSGLRLLTLGTPRIERDGVSLDLQYRKNVALVVYLALTGERHTREALLALLWPEREPSRARASLRRNLSLLRKALGGEVLVVDRETVSLDPEADIWFDVDQFRRLLPAWREHGHPVAEVCPECLVALAEAAELYRGDFLSGFSLSDSLAFDEWQFFETEELRRELTVALERLVRGHSAQGGYATALPYARHWLSLDPLHEPAHRHLMLLYAQTGQRSAALRQYAECARVLEAELGLSPSRETTSLYERLRAQSVDRELSLSSITSPRLNLPAQTTPFIGRKATLSAIAQRLRTPDCRLLSLVGPGGIGKTRLALEAAREQVDNFGDGVVWVPLAPLRSIETVVSALAQATGCPSLGGQDPWGQLLRHLREKQMLLVLDNVEHLLAEHLPDAEHPSERGVVDLVTAILQTTPGVKIVITSRVRPNVQSEYLLPLSGMEVPALKALAPDGASALGAPSLGRGESKPPTGYSAVQLFLATARRVRPGFEPDAAALTDVIRICHRVQGMPLAILLAATWIEMLSPAEIVAELGQGYGLLEANLRDLPERQQSIETVCETSWKMLDESEREACARLSLFRGGFTRDAAAKAAGASLRTLASLVHKSWLQRDPVGRYSVHELLRQYAEQRLADIPGEKERVSDQHCQYYAELLQRGWMEVLAGASRQRLMTEIDNLRQGRRWAVNQARWTEIETYRQYLGELRWYEGMLQEMATSNEWAARVLQRHYADRPSKESGIALAQGLINLGWTGKKWDPARWSERGNQLIVEGVSILRQVGAQRELAARAEYVAYEYGPKRESEARQIVQESITYYRERGELDRIPTLLVALGEPPLRHGKVDEAERHIRSAIALGQEIDDPVGVELAFFILAKIAYLRGDYETARQLYENALAGAERANERTYIAMLYSFLGDTALAAGDYQAARARHRQALARYSDMNTYWSEVASGQHYGQAYSLDRLGDIALALDDVERARSAYRQALQFAYDHPCTALNLDIVVSHAALLAHDGEKERVVELAALVLHHPKGYVEVKARARRVLEPLKTELPPDLFVGAEVRGRARDLEATVRELFAENQNG